MILFGPHSVTVQPAIKRRNSVGGWEFTYGGQEHVFVGLTVQQADPVEGETQNSNALTVRGRGATCTCHGLPWSYGSASRVVWHQDPVPGRVFDQDGEVQTRSVGRFTRHIQVQIMARSGVV